MAKGRIRAVCVLELHQNPAQGEKEGFWEETVLELGLKEELGVSLVAREGRKALPRGSVYQTFT